MVALGIEGAHALKPKPRSTIPAPGVEVCDDLVERDFSPQAPNRTWVADIKLVDTTEGWLYVAAVTDCFSRRVVGHAADHHMEAALIESALEIAVARRTPTDDLIHHSDHGSQYTSLAFGGACKRAGIARSMGSVGDCYDNAVAESLWATLEKELLMRRSFATRAQARGAIFDYFETFYNPSRRHSANGGVSPAAYEEAFERRATEQPSELVATG